MSMTESYLEKDTQDTTIHAVEFLTILCNGLSIEKGWWSGFDKSNELEIPARLCLIHSEISEAMESARKNLNDEHIDGRKGLEVELADALIRICDLAGGLELDLAGAVRDKLLYNINRDDHKKENRIKENGKKF